MLIAAPERLSISVGTNVLRLARLSTATWVSNLIQISVAVERRLVSNDRAAAARLSLPARRF